MLFKPDLKFNDKAVFIQTHIPRTGGTSLWGLFHKLFGADAFLHAYKGGIEAAAPAAVARCRFTSSHMPYGQHEYFPGECYYITVTRDPVARYQSLYAEFLTNPKSNIHPYALRYNIDDFLKFCLNSDVPNVANQLGNLQCRMVSGSDQFWQAKKFIDENYLIACPLPEMDLMVEMLRDFIGAGTATTMETHHVTADKMQEFPGRLQLADATLELLLEREAADIRLHSHVQQSFRRAFEDWRHWKARQNPQPAGSGPIKPMSLPLPPTELRFMQDDDATLMSIARGSAKKVVEALPAADGRGARILDVGCGYGRLAYGLREREFAGDYVGFDILVRQIGWLEQNFNGGDSYRFHHIDLHNERYNPDGRPLSEIEFPFEEKSFDCMVAMSVFTHMYEEDIVSYIRRLSPFLRDGGLLIATFFRVPPGFVLGDTFPESAYPLIKQISENSFIASEEEPLWVIAYKEDFLLRMFAREGYEVVSQRKGRWLTQADALEFQDLFVLRKKSAPRPLAIGIEPPRGRFGSSACPICGSMEFGPGPLGRMGSNGAPPCCLGCGSLERHRITSSLFNALPIGSLNWRRALQLRSNSRIRPGWFQSLDDLAIAQTAGLVERLLTLPDGGYDFILLEQILEFVQDDRAIFSALNRKLSSRGIMLIICGNAGTEKKETIDFAAPTGAFGQWHAYGEDLPGHFGLDRLGLRSLVVKVTDPQTEGRESIHLLFKDDADFREMRVRLGVAAGLSQVVIP